MIIERAELPGIGIGYVARTARDRRIGVVVHRTGRRDLVLYDPEDPERAATTVTLDAAEGECLANLLTDTTTVVTVTGPLRRGGRRRRNSSRPATSC